MSIVDQRTVLILSDDAEFPRQVSGRWQSERMVPTFTVLGSNLQHGFDSDAFDLAVVGPLRRDALRPAVRSLEASGRPVIVVSEASPTAQALGLESSRVLAVRRSEGWPDTVVLVAIEILRRVDAVNRAERAEHVSARLKCHATLGQYVIEMRHTLNNALTSVLGNSELLLLEPGTFSAGVRSQIDTIRNMALRMHEILQRFSSLEKELTFVETQAVKEQTRKAQAAAVGQ
jgi:signal transduction histidine kinase